MAFSVQPPYLGVYFLRGPHKMCFFLFSLVSHGHHKKGVPSKEEAATGGPTDPIGNMGLRKGLQDRSASVGVSSFLDDKRVSRTLVGFGALPEEMLVLGTTIV